MKRNLDKWFLFIESFLIRIIILFVTSFYLINHILVITDQNYSLGTVDNWFQDSVGQSIVDLQSTLLTVASIFIGIYFAVFTLLISVNKNSVFAILSQKNFNKLIRFIIKSFLGAFAYILITLLTILYSTTNGIENFYLILLTFIIIMYMFLCAFRLGLITYIAFRKSLKNMKQQIDEEKAKEQEFYMFIQRMDTFLRKYENDRNREKAEKLNELYEDRHSND